jgi:membrane protease subunit (stomatin/prohibitin family)
MMKSDVKPNIQIDKRVAQYVMIRDEIEAIEERHRQELKPFVKAKERLTGELLEFLDGNGLKSAKTTAGSIRISVRHTGVCTDPDRFMDFVFEHNLRDLIDRRANGVACRDYAEAHDGVLPPGVKINSMRTIGVTRA